MLLVFPQSIQKCLNVDIALNFTMACVAGVGTVFIAGQLGFLCGSRVLD